MNFLSISRDMARLGYAAVRQSLTVLDEQVVARYWDAAAPVRAGFERFLESMDAAAGRLLAGGDLPGPGDDGMPGPGARDVPGTGAATSPAPGDVPGPGTGAAPSPAPLAGTVEVIFTLPGEVGASSVALCGEFNEWSADGIPLERRGDGSWRATVALPPGRRYRYRYLLDGGRWENAWEADQYVPNPFGGTDSVVIVACPPYHLA